MHEIDVIKERTAGETMLGDLARDQVSSDDTPGFSVLNDQVEFGLA